MYHSFTGNKFGYLCMRFTHVQVSRSGSFFHTTFGKKTVYYWIRYKFKLHVEVILKFFISKLKWI